MKNGKWSNLFGGICAATTIGTVAAVSRHFTKKYGQKINNEKIVPLELGKIINSGIDKFLNTDDDQLLSRIDAFLKKDEKQGE